MELCCTRSRDGVVKQPVYLTINNGNNGEITLHDGAWREAELTLETSLSSFNHQQDGVVGLKDLPRCFSPGMEAMQQWQTLLQQYGTQ